MVRPGAEALPSVMAMTTICSSRFLWGSMARSASLPVSKVTDEPPVFSPSQMSEPEAVTPLALRSEHFEPPACAEAEG